MENQVLFGNRSILEKLPNYFKILFIAILLLSWTPYFMEDPAMQFLSTVVLYSNHILHSIEVRIVEFLTLSDEFRK